MKLARRAFAVVMVLAVSLFAAPPAQAGGWAATVLDPLSTRIEPNQTYTVGYWVMQHAAHPYDGGYGPLGKTGLKIVVDDGTTHTFDGVPLGQPAHYAATLAVPQRGTWQLYALQGLFDDYLIGTLTVPGGLQARPLPASVAGHEDRHRWGLIQSPDLAAMRAEVPEHAKPAIARGTRTDDRLERDNHEAGEAVHAHDGSRTGIQALALWALLGAGILAGTIVLATHLPARIRRRNLYDD